MTRTTPQTYAERVSRLLEANPHGLLVEEILRQTQGQRHVVRAALAELCDAGYAGWTWLGYNGKLHKLRTPYRAADHDPRAVPPKPPEKRPDAGLAELNWQLRSGARGRAPEGMFS